MTRAERIEQAARALLEALPPGKPGGRRDALLAALSEAPPALPEPAPVDPAQENCRCGCHTRGMCLDCRGEHRSAPVDPPRGPCNAESRHGHHCRLTPGHSGPHIDQHGNPWTGPGQGERPGMAEEGARQQQSVLGTSEPEERCTGCWVERQSGISRPMHQHTCRFSQTGTTDDRGLAPKEEP